MITLHQEYLYRLYKEIDEICKKYDIKYQLAGGTLIGAIRHRGFIPWDDDMDITMTRKEWNKFVKICNEGALPPNRVLECQENNRGYHNMVARYTDTTCTALHKTQLMHEDTAGFVIDILIYDGLPNTGKALEQYTKDLMLYSDLLNDSIVYSYRYDVSFMKYMMTKLKIKLKGRDAVLKQLEDRMSQYDEDECDYLVLHWGGIPLVFNRKTFGESRVFLPIEDTVGQCPDRPFDYLVEHYGDEWMYIPPVTEQQSHEAVFNTEIHYSAIKDEIFHFVNKKKVKKKYRMKKYIALSHKNGWQSLNNDKIKIRMLARKMEISQKLRAAAEEIEQFRKEENYFELKRIFGEYIGYQNKRFVSGRGDYSGAYRYFNPILFDMGVDTYELAIKILFNTGSVGVAKRFIEIFEMVKGKKTPLMEEIDKDIDLFRQAVSSFACKEYDISAPIIKDLFAKYPKNISIIKLKINEYIKLQNIADCKEEVNALVEHGLMCMPEDGDLMKYKLDIEFLTDKENTLLNYIDAWYGTYNGLVRLDIVDIITENLDFYFDYCEKHILDKDEEDEQYVVVRMMNRLNKIVPDNIEIMNKRFDIFRTLAEKLTDPVEKAIMQNKLVKNILRTRKTYEPLFRMGKYSEIEALVTRWYYKYVTELTGSEFVTHTTAEVIVCEDYDHLKDIRLRLEKKLDNTDKSSDEYYYVLELYGRVLYALGESKMASNVFMQCAEGSNIPYLNRLLRADFIKELRMFYGELYTSYNSSFIHKFAETSGLDIDEAFEKTQANKERLIRFYIDRIKTVYPKALSYLNILAKVGLVTEEEAAKIKKTCRINEKSKIGFKLIANICDTCEDINTKIDERVSYLEEIRKKKFELDKQSENDSAIYD